MRSETLQSCVRLMIPVAHPGPGHPSNKPDGEALVDLPPVVGKGAL